MPTKNRKPDRSGIHFYLAMKRYRAEATFCYRCGEEPYYLLNNHKLTEDQLNSMFPLTLSTPNIKGPRIGSSQQIY